MNWLAIQRPVFPFLFLLPAVIACSLGSGTLEPQPSPALTLTQRVSEAKSTPTRQTGQLAPTGEPLLPSPVIAPGTFADFESFAPSIAQALEEGDPAFFADHASASSWSCLGDEAFGVCQGQAAGTVLNGVPVSQDWQSYTLFAPTDYGEMRKVLFGPDLRLALRAVSHQFGDNPLMPMAAESFHAIVTGSTPATDSSASPVRVLFFEYHDGSWWLQGVLIATAQGEQWLLGSCGSCYDEWRPWSH